MTSESNENLRQLLRSRCNEYGDKTFLFSEGDGRSWSYNEFDEAAGRTANMLRSNGAVKGSVVSLLLPNSAEYVIAYFACWKIGAIAGPVNSLLKPEEIEWIVNNSEAKLLLAGSQFAESLAGIEKPPLILFDDVDKAAKDQRSDVDEVWLESSDEAIMIYTSGTTGKPKGCLLTHANIIANARQISEGMNFGESDRLLTVMPLFHMNAVSVTTMSALYAGASTVVSSKFSASKFWETVDKYKITSFGSVATMLSMLLSANGSDEKKTDRAGSSTLRFAMCGSAPVPAETIRQFESTFGCLVVEGYGLSESTCRSTFNPPNQDRRPGSCGKPIGNEMRIVDDNDADVPDRELGEIVMRGENIFKEYFRDPDATEKAFRNGWFHTGDIGYRDDDGFYYIADRRSDMIIRGGENIYPREIDELLYTHPAVEAAAVIGVPDELYGEEVVAFVVLKEGGEINAEALIEFCKKHLADYKCPRAIHFVADIPKGPTGKLLKRELAEKYIDLLK